MDELSHDLRSQSSVVNKKLDLIELIRTLPEEAPDTLTLMYQRGPGGNIEHIFGRRHSSIPAEARDIMKKAATNAFNEIREMLVKRLEEL